MYFDYLWGMLQPLGVYSASGYHIGELKTLGEAMDCVQKKLEQYGTEAAPGTATEAGLSLWEELFPLFVSTNTTDRREALMTLLSVDGQWGSKEGLTKILGACGIPVTITEEEEPFCCQVTVEENLVIIRDPVFQFQVLEHMIPCHMKVTVTVTYYDIRTSTTVSETMDLEDVKDRSRKAWEQRLGYLA